MGRNSSELIEQIIVDDLGRGLSPEKLRFRFRQNPMAYLHIGHAGFNLSDFGLGEKHTCLQSPKD